MYPQVEYVGIIQKLLAALHLHLLYLHQKHQQVEIMVLSHDMQIHSSLSLQFQLTRPFLFKIHHTLCHQTPHMHRHLGFIGCLCVCFRHMQSCLNSEPILIAPTTHYPPPTYTHWIMYCIQQLNLVMCVIICDSY